MSRILYLTHRLPYPPNRGDRIRSWHTLQFLAERAQVYLGCLTEEPLAGDVLPRLADVCAEVQVAALGRTRWLRGAAALASGRSATEGLFRSSALRQVVRRWAGRVQFDAVLVFCSSMYQFARVAELRKVPVFVDLVDVDSQKWFDYAVGAGRLKRWLFQLEGRRVRRLECQIAARSQAVVLVSEAEADVFRRFCPGDNVYAIPNGVDLDYFSPPGQWSVNSQSPPASGLRPPTAAADRLVFVGVLDYRANVEGLRWFCRDVWPTVRQRVPGATLAIVGRRPSEAVRRLADQPGVEVVGEVPDVRPHVRRAAAVIAPLHVARGMQNKVLEALALGRPVVATPQALEGLGAIPGEDVLQADTPAEWADQLVRLFRDDGLRGRLAANGRRYVETHHSWQACLEPFAELFHRSESSVHAHGAP